MAKATKKKTNSKMGRPAIIIDRDEFEKLCTLLPTANDVAGWFNCSVDTIERFCKKTYDMTFADTLKQKGAEARVSLRRKQLSVAMNGNVTMLIWLGKQILGQKERQELEHSGSDKLPLKIVLTNGIGNSGNKDSDDS